MIPSDPLHHLLHTADAASPPPSPHTNLPAQVRQQYSRQLHTARQWKIAAATTTAAAMMLVIIVALINTHKSPVPQQNESWVIAASISLREPPVSPGGAGPVDAVLAHQPTTESGPTSAIGKLSPAELAQLKTQADALGAQADALEKQLNLARQEQTRQDLRDEYRRQLAVNVHADVEESPIDRAAAIALGNGDYYWQVQQDRAPAEAAYQSVLDNFPTSHWAELAKERLSQFQMN